MQILVFDACMGAHQNYRKEEKMENLTYRAMSRPLSKTHYFRHEKKEKLVSIDDIGEIYAKVDVPFPEVLDYHIPEDETRIGLEDFSDILVHEDTREDEPKKEKRKIELFEDIEIDFTKEGIEKAINQDGYYNEMLPKDAGKSFKKSRDRIDIKKIGFVAALVIISVLGFVFSIKNFV